MICSPASLPMFLMTSCVGFMFINLLVCQFFFRPDYDFAESFGRQVGRALGWLFGWVKNFLAPKPGVHFVKPLSALGSDGLRNRPKLQFERFEHFERFGV